MFIPLFILLLVFAFSVLAFGLKGRIVGNEPHCRSCKYNLTGAVANNCPECGTPLAIDSVRWGLRRRRPIALIASILLIAVTTTGIYVNARSVRWMAHYPFQFVSFMARRGDANAVSELWRRWQATELTSLQLKEVIRAGLDAQAGPRTDTSTRWWLMLLAEFDARQVLSAEERERYHAQIIHALDLKTVPRLREGEPLPVALTAAFRARDLGFGELRQATVRIGESEHSMISEHRTSGHYLAPDRETHFFIHHQQKPGDYAVSFVFRIEMDDFTQSRPNVSKEWIFSKNLEIIPREVSQHVSMTDPTGLNIGEVPWLSARPGLYSRSRLPGVTPVDTIELDLTARSILPWSIAFDVFAASNGMMSHLGTIYGWKDSRFVMSNLRPVNRSELSDDTLDLILRSNSAIADRTVDLHQVVNGEFRLSVKVNWPDSDWSSSHGNAYFQRFNDFNNPSEIHVARKPPSHFLLDLPPTQKHVVRASPFPSLSQDEDAASMYHQAVRTFEADGKIRKARQESLPSRSNYYDGAGWDLKRRVDETPHREANHDAIGNTS